MSTPSAPDLTLLYTRPTDRVDIFLPAPGGGSYGVANYVQAKHANAIIDAVQEHGIVLDLLADLVDDLIIDQPSTPAIAAARAYLSTRP